MTENNARSKNNNSFFYAMLIYINTLFFGMYPFLKSSANAAYITVLVCTLFAVGLTVFFSLLIDKFKIKIDDIYSPPLMRYVSATFFIFSLINCSVLLACTIQCSFRYFMPQSPYKYLALFFCVSAIFGTYAGGGALKSYGKAVSICIFLLALYFIFSSSRNIKIQRVFPLLGNNIKSTFFSINGMALFANIIYLFAYNLSTGESLCKTTLPTAIKSIIVAGIFTAIMCFLYAMCVPYEIAASTAILPSYYIASVSGLGIIFNRCEILLLTAWIFAAMTSLSFMANATSLSLCDALKLSDRRGVSPIVVLMIYCISIILLKFDIINLSKKFSEIFTVYVIHLPFICIIIYKNYQKRMGDKNVSTQTV